METVLDHDSQVMNYPYASFLHRLIAVLIDALILAVINFLVNLVLPDGMLANGLTAIAGWIYFATMHSSEKQATVGKQAMGLIVTDLEGKRITFGKATVRYIGRIISACILLIGFIIQPFTEKKQTLHDMIAKTVVYKTN